MILGGAFIRAVIVAGVGGSQLGHLVIFYMAVFDLVHILPADLDAAVFGDDQHAAFHILVPDGSGIAETAHAATHEVEVDEAGVFKVCQLLVVEVGETGLDIADVAKQPVHDVDEVGELGEKRSAVEGCIAMPSAGLIIAVVAVPIAVQLHHIYLPQLAGFHHFLDPYRGGGIAVLHDTKYLFTVFQGGIDDLFGICQREGHGFLYYDMVAGFYRLYGHGGMETIGGTDVDDVDGEVAVQEV